MNSENQTAQHIVVTSTKSVGVSLILTILFGPLGMFYSTIWGGIIMMVTSVILALITAGFSLIITWPICVIWGALAVSGENRRILDQISQKF